MKKFVESYSGNGSEAAKLAGYSGNHVVLASIASRLLKRPEIAKAVKERQDLDLQRLVANRTDRMKFWSDVMRTESALMSDRLRASELLAKAQMDFTERHEVVGAVATTEQLLALMRERTKTSSHESDDATKS